MAKPQTSAIRVATLIVEGHAPVTRVEYTPGLSGRAPTTLRDWFRRQFGDGTLKVTRWRFKHTPGFIEVRGYVQTSPQAQSPRTTKAPRPLQLRPAKTKPVAKYATRVRKARREAYQAQAKAKQTLPRQPKAAAPRKASPPRTAAPRQTGQPNHATTAHLLVVNHNADGTVSGMMWHDLPDQGRPEGNLSKAARALVKRRGVNHCNLLLQSGKQRHTEQVYALGGKPLQRLVVVYTHGLTLPTLQPLKNLNTSCLTSSLRVITTQRTLELAQELTLRRARHAKREAAISASKAKQNQSFLPEQQAQTATPASPRPAWLPEVHQPLPQLSA